MHVLQQPCTISLSTQSTEALHFKGPDLVSSEHTLVCCHSGGTPPCRAFYHVIVRVGNMIQCTAMLFERRHAKLSGYQLLWDSLQYAQVGLLARRTRTPRDQLFCDTRQCTAVLAARHHADLVCYQLFRDDLQCQTVLAARRHAELVVSRLLWNVPNF